MHERISQRRTCSSHKHNHTHTPFFFFCKGGSDRLMKRASYSCCISLCVVLAAAHLKCRRYCLFLPFVRHFFFIVTHTGTHTHTHTHKKKKKITHTRPIATFTVFCFSEFHVLRLLMKSSFVGCLRPSNVHRVSLKLCLWFFGRCDGMCSGSFLLRAGRKAENVLWKQSQKLPGRALFWKFILGIN